MGYLNVVWQEKYLAECLENSIPSLPPKNQELCFRTLIDNSKAVLHQTAKNSAF